MLDMGGQWATKDGLVLIEEGTKGFLTSRGMKKVSDYTRGQGDMQYNNSQYPQYKPLDSGEYDNTNLDSRENTGENEWYNHDNWHEIFGTDILGPRLHLQTDGESNTSYSNNNEGTYNRTKLTKKERGIKTLTNDIYDSMLEENTDNFFSESQSYNSFPKEEGQNSQSGLIVFRARQTKGDWVNTYLTLEPGDVLQVSAKGDKTGKKVTLKIADIDFGLESLVNRKTRPNPSQNTKGGHREGQNRRSNALYNAYITCEVI